MYHILYIHSLVDGHLGYSHLLAILKNAGMNMGVQISVRVPTCCITFYDLASEVK